MSEHTEVPEPPSVPAGPAPSDPATTGPSPAGRTARPPTPTRRRHLRVVREPRILLVGGSVTGPATALLLHRAGFEDVTLAETTPEARSRGGGVLGLLHPNLDVLDRAEVDQDEYVADPSEIVRTIPVHDRCPTAARTWRYPGRNTTWPLLNSSLTRRLPDGMLRTGRRVTGLTTSGPGGLGGLLVEFDGGDTEQVDLVVFADGRASTGRQLLDPARRLRYVGYVAHRGQTDRPGPDLEGFHRYEPALGGCQFNVAPIPGGGIDWTLYLRASRAEYAAWYGKSPTRRVYARHGSDGARDRVDACAAAALPADLADLVAGTTERAAAPVLDIAAPTRMVWPVGDGHAVLLGDALAPVRPHTGMGANLGIQQGAALAAVLAQHQRHGADLDAGLRGWEQQQLPPVAAALRAGRDAGTRLGLGRT